MKDSDIKQGDHCWAIMAEKLVAVMKNDEGTYWLCGPWECRIQPDDLDLLELIPPPKARESTQLYYE